MCIRDRQKDTEIEKVKPIKTVEEDVKQPVKEDKPEPKKPEKKEDKKETKKENNDNEISATISNVKPVSYTHLDVYKRQLLYYS